jgi:hypothetical protein
MQARTIPCALDPTQFHLDPTRNPCGQLTRAQHCCGMRSGVLSTSRWRWRPRALAWGLLPPLLLVAVQLVCARMLSAAGGNREPQCAAVLFRPSSSQELC